MLKRFLPFKGPLSYHFVDPDTGQSFEAVDKQDLIKQIQAYRKQNELSEIELISEIIDHYLCGWPENLGKCGKNPDISRNWWTYLKGGVLLLKNVLVFNPVSQEEADRRGEICSKCPYNKTLDGARYHAWADKLAAASVPGKKSKYHNQLANCEVCSCPLKVKVFVSPPYGNTKDQERKMRVVGCWQILD